MNQTKLSWQNITQPNPKKPAQAQIHQDQTHPNII